MTDGLLRPEQHGLSATDLSDQSIRKKNRSRLKKKRFVTEWDLVATNLCR